MPRYEVCFIRYFTYEVEGEDEESAVQKAESLFESEMRSPIARTDYDDVEIEYIGDIEEED